MSEVRVNLDQPQKRVIYLDILRILAIIGVITIHTVAVKIQDIQAIGEMNWWWADILNGMTRWAVPVFFMISGVLTLENKQLENISSFLKTRFIKLGIPFLIWSAIYSIIMEEYILGKSIRFPEIIGIILRNILFDKSYYHLWFVYDIFIIYLISPFIKKIVLQSTKKNLQYWLGLWFVATILYPTIQEIMTIIGLKDYLYIHILNIPFVFGLSGYYVLGYYLNKYSPSKKWQIVIYICTIGAFLMTILGTYFISKSKNVLNENLYSHFSITTLIISIGIFILIKNIKWDNCLTDSLKKLIASVSNTVFGIYLIHMVLIIHFSASFNFMMTKSYICYTLSIIIISFILSFFFVKLIRLMPKVGKYLI